MARNIPLKRYSVYRRKDDKPIAIFATRRECAAALGIDLNTFACYITRQRAGKQYPKKIVIYEDEIDEEEKESLISPGELSDVDYKIIRVLPGRRICEVAELLCCERSNISYHLRKIRKITGLNPKNRNDQEELLRIAMERGK